MAQRQRTEAGPEQVTGPDARQPAPAADQATNRVLIAGKVTTAPAERELPSGDVITTFRVSVPRLRTPLSGRSATTVDWMDCVTAGSRCRRAVAGWQVGDLVTLEGVLRRRFYRSASGAGSTLEVEVLKARRTKRG